MSACLARLPLRRGSHLTPDTNSSQLYRHLPPGISHTHAHQPHTHLIQPQPGSHLTLPSPARLHHLLQQSTETCAWCMSSIDLGSHFHGHPTPAHTPTSLPSHLQEACRYSLHPFTVYSQCGPACTMSVLHVNPSSPACWLGCHSVPSTHGKAME